MGKCKENSITTMDVDIDAELMNKYLELVEVVGDGEAPFIKTLVEEALANECRNLEAQIAWYKGKEKFLRSLEVESRKMRTVANRVTERAINEDMAINTEYHKYSMDLTRIQAIARHMEAHLAEGYRNGYLAGVRK